MFCSVLLLFFAANAVTIVRFVLKFSDSQPHLFIAFLSLAHSKTIRSSSALLSLSFSGCTFKKVLCPVWNDQNAQFILYMVIVLWLLLLLLPAIAELPLYDFSQCCDRVNAISLLYVYTTYSVSFHFIVSVFFVFSLLFLLIFLTD